MSSIFCLFLFVCCRPVILPVDKGKAGLLLFRVFDPLSRWSDTMFAECSTRPIDKDCGCMALLGDVSSTIVLFHHQGSVEFLSSSSSFTFYFWRVDKKPGPHSRRRCRWRMDMGKCREPLFEKGIPFSLGRIVVVVFYIHPSACILCVCVCAYAVYILWLAFSGTFPPSWNRIPSLSYSDLSRASMAKAERQSRK